jgi:DNA end-binding protein Ku
LKKTLEGTDRVAIARLTIRQKEHLCCIRPYDSGLMLETMYYPDEVRGNNELELPEEQAVVTQAEMNMAAMLVDHLTGPFTPADFQDSYRLALEKVIESKLTGTEPIKAAPAAPKGKVGDLMEALKASIAAIQGSREPAAPAETAEEQPEPATARRRRAKVG